MATNQRQVALEDLEVAEEFLADVLSETQTNQPGTSRNTLNTARPLIPDSATTFEGENDVPTFSRRTVFPCNASQMGRPEPRRITISSHSYPTEAPGPSNFKTNYEHPISVPSVGQNQPSFEVSSFHQFHQHSSMNFPNSGQICSTFGHSSLAENVHSYRVSGSHQNQQPLVDTSYPGQPFGVQTFNQTEPTSTSSFDETQGSTMVSSLQVQPSLGYTSSYQSETPFGITRENQNSLVETTSTSANTHDASLAIPCQPSMGLSLQSSHNQHQTFSTTLASSSCELRLQSYPSTSSKPVSETDANGQNSSRKKNSTIPWVERKKRSMEWESSLECHYSRTPGASFECNKCKKIFTTKAIWKRHYKKMHCDGEELSCNKCGKVFTRRDNLQQHERTVHTDGENPSFPCTKCGKVMISERSLKRHQLDNHSKKGFECKICGRLFKRRCALQRHQLTHRKRLECKICGRVFQRSCDLQRHQHSKALTCNICGRVFRRKYDLKWHQLTHKFQ